MQKLIRCAFAFCAAVALTGCSSYKAGTTENNVYKNEAAGFQITTPENYICYDEAHYNKCGYYDVNKLQANVRGAEKSWKCEYAAQSPACQVLVCSEENVKDETLEEYAQHFGEQVKIDLLDLKLKSVEDARLGDRIFKKVSVTSGSFDINIYIRQVDDTFVYIYQTIVRNDRLPGQEQEMLDNITKLG